ncbi:MAG: flagellar basal body rod C-terminal domain-containing protein [Pseudomonadota bacterium]
MNPFKASMSQAVAGMQLQSQRIGVTAENLSNVDTPGYRRKLLVPQMGQTSAEAFRSVAQVVLDQSEGEVKLDPAHPLADENGYVTMSNVSLVTEMADLREANRSYEANLNSFQQARTMYRSLLDVLRR